MVDTWAAKSLCRGIHVSKSISMGVGKTYRKLPFSSSCSATFPLACSGTFVVVGCLSTCDSHRRWHVKQFALNK